MSVFNTSVLLLTISFVITLLKYLVCGIASWIRSYYDNHGYDEIHDQ